LYYHVAEPHQKQKLIVKKYLPMAPVFGILNKLLIRSSVADPDPGLFFIRIPDPAHCLAKLSFIFFTFLFPQFV
jgi:hypothetical protein